MILVFVLASSFTATLAAATALIMGHSWWVGLASYIGSGTLTVFVLGVFMAFAPKKPVQRLDAQTMRMPMADH